MKKHVSQPALIFNSHETTEKPYTSDKYTLRMSRNGPLTQQPSYFDQHFSSFRSSLEEGSLYQGSPENNIEKSCL